MIQFTRFELENGLRLLIHEDVSSPLVAVNVLYNVGARDESPDKTGFAHLFEHLMFGGSENVKDFDEHIQLAGGDSNAFTNNDITNFYNVLPKENVETALWLESDRMNSLAIEENKLKIQQNVVVEEFKESCLNQPYGDVWHHIADMAYEVHPYRWPTIGKIPEHVRDATLEDVQDFFDKYYCPNNAVIVVSGNIKTKLAKDLVEKWFGDISRGPLVPRRLPEEPPQRKINLRNKIAKVPVDALYLAFHTPERKHKDYYVTDLLSDILCNGQSSRLFRRLVKEQKLFTQIDAYITGNIDPGLLIIEGKTAPGTSLEEGEAAIWEELNQLCNQLLPEKELQKYKNKVESALVFSEANILNKAINLAFFELLDDAELINSEAGKYEVINTADIQRVACEILSRENCSELYYRAE